jgi:hypothetical protein
LSILPKCIALVPLLVSTSTRINTAPSESTIVSAAKYRCIGLSSDHHKESGANCFIIVLSRVPNQPRLVELNAKRRADEKLTAFVELESAVRLDWDKDTKWVLFDPERAP